MELDRTKKCDCWTKLDYCPVGCNDELIETTTSLREKDLVYEEVQST